MEKLKTKFNEATAELGCHIDTLEGVEALLHDLLEEFTAASMSVDSENRHRKARHKLSTLITLMGYGLSDLNRTMGEVFEMSKHISFGEEEK